MAEQAALIEKLQEEDAFIEFPTEAHAWTLAEIQTFNDTCGEIAPGEPEGRGTREENTTLYKIESSSFFALTRAQPGRGAGLRYLSRRAWLTELLRVIYGAKLC